MSKSMELAKAVIIDKLAQDPDTRRTYIDDLGMAMADEHRFNLFEEIDFRDKETRDRYAECALNSILSVNDYKTLPYSQPPFAPQEDEHTEVQPLDGYDGEFGLTR